MRLKECINPEGVDNEVMDFDIHLEGISISVKILSSKFTSDT